MRMNRRNVLMGLGTIVAGGGAALGTGAFSQVEADRTLDVGTADDDGAYLELAPESSFASSSGTGSNGQNLLTIDLSSLNDDATTTLDPAFTITNGLSEGVGVRVRSNGYGSGSEPNGLTIESTDGTSLLDYPSGSGVDNNLAANGSSGDSVSVRLVIDTSQLDVSTIDTLTISASTEHYTSS